MFIAPKNRNGFFSLIGFEGKKKKILFVKEQQKKIFIYLFISRRNHGRRKTVSKKNQAKAIATWWQTGITREVLKSSARSLRHNSLGRALS